VYAYNIFLNKLYAQFSHTLAGYGVIVHPRTSKTMQTVQNKVFRIIANAPWFVRNANLHKDFQIQDIQAIIKTLATNFHSSHPNSSGEIHYK